MTSTSSPSKCHVFGGKTAKERVLTLISAAAVYTALAILSLTVGYWAGVGSSLLNTRSGLPSAAYPKEGEKEAQTADDNESISGSDEDDEVPEGEELSAVKAGLLEECKLVRFHFYLDEKIS